MIPSLASVLATEEAIAETVSRGTATTDAAVLDPAVVTKAVTDTEERLGQHHTAGQVAAVVLPAMLFCCKL